MKTDKPKSHSEPSSKAHTSPSVNNHNDKRMQLKRKALHNANTRWIAVCSFILILLILYWVFFIAIRLGPNQ